MQDAFNIQLSFEVSSPKCLSHIQSENFNSCYPRTQNIIIPWVMRQNEIFKLVIPNINVLTKERILTEKIILFEPNKL